jgi:hypothetical protein
MSATSIMSMTFSKHAFALVSDPVITDKQIEEAIKRGDEAYGKPVEEIR